MYLGLAVVATWPLATDLGGHIYGHIGGDGIGGIAYFESWKTSLLEGHLGHDYTFAYPYGANLSSNPIQPLFFASMFPLTLIFGGTVAFNMLDLLSFPLSAMGMFALARFLGMRRSVAFAAGVFYGFSSYHAGHASGHVPLSHTEFFPVIVLSMLAWRRRPGIRRALAAVCVLAATFLWDYYFAVFALLMLAAIAIAFLVADLRTAGWRAAIGRFASMALIIATSTAVVLPVFLLLRSGLQRSGFSARSSSEVLIFSARACQLVLPWRAHPQLGGLGCSLGGLPPAETALYLGLVAMLLAAFFLLTALLLGMPGGLSRDLWVGVAVAIVGLVWAIPATWQAWLHVSPPGLLWRFVPGLRVSSRSVVLVQLGLALLASAGLERLIVLLHPARRRHPRVEPWMLSGLAAALFFGESIGVASVAGPIPHPAVNVWLESQPQGTVVIQYPRALSGQVGEDGRLYFYAYNHVQYRRNEVGTSIAAPNEGVDLGVELWAVDDRTAAELRAAGVRYAISHTSNLYTLPATNDVLANVPGLRPVWRGEGDTVYEVVAPPEPFAYLTGDFQVVEGPSRQDYARWMAASGRIAVVNPFDHPVTESLRLQLWCLGSCERDVVVRGDGVDQTVKGTGPEEVLVNAPPGRSYIQLIPPRPPRRISAVEDRQVTLYVFRPILRPA